MGDQPSKKVFHASHVSAQVVKPMATSLQIPAPLMTSLRLYHVIAMKATLVCVPFCLTELISSITDLSFHSAACFVPFTHVTFCVPIRFSDQMFAKHVTILCCYSINNQVSQSFCCIDCFVPYTFYGASSLTLSCSV